MPFGRNDTSAFSRFQHGCSLSSFGVAEQIRLHFFQKKKAPRIAKKLPEKNGDTTLQCLIVPPAAGLC